MRSKRIEWIDAAKGTGMIFVILGHTVIPNSILNFILSFHMPLFFFLSGYTFKITKINFKDFVIKKLKTLILPYAIFSIITYIFWVSIERRITMGSSTKINIYKPLIGILYANNINEYMIFDGVLWFIVCLFITEIIFYVICNFFKSKKLIGIVLVVFSVIGYLDSLFMHIRLPWSIDVAFTAVVFMGVGYLISSYANKISSIKGSLRFIIIIVAIFTDAIFSKLNHSVYMYNNTYGNYLYFYIAAFAGIIMCVLISTIVQKSKILKYIGKNSFIILAIHPKVLKALQFIAFKLFKVNNVTINYSLLFGIIFTFASIVILIPIINIINCYFPLILGKSRKNAISDK